MRKNIKVVIAFLLGGIIFGTLGVYAGTVSSSVINYTKPDNTNTTVEGALNEIYDGIKDETYTFSSEQISSVTLDNFYKSFDLSSVYNKGIEDGAGSSTLKRVVISSGTNYGSYDVKSNYPSIYSSLTTDNFAMQISGAYINAGGSGDRSGTLSYNSTTGVVSWTLPLHNAGKCLVATILMYYV